MPEIVVTWVVRHRRLLEPGEDPLNPSTTDEEHLLWALEEGECSTSVSLVE